jgi:hypothetical protein
VRSTLIVDWSIYTEAISLDASAEKPIATHAALHAHTASTAASKANRKRGQMSKSLARAKLEKGVELADRLRTKASKRQHQVEKKKRAKEST